MVSSLLFLHYFLISFFTNALSKILSTFVWKYLAHIVSGIRNNRAAKIVNESKNTRPPKNRIDSCIFDVTKKSG